MEDINQYLKSILPEFKEQFKGTLTIDQAEEGIKKVIENGKELLEDALILMKSDRFSRAITLAILAVEEISKIEIIKKILLANGDSEEVWREFSNHRFKNHSWLYPVLKKFEIPTDQIVDFQGEKSKWVKRINDLKNYSIYLTPMKSEGKNNFSWMLPKDILDKEITNHVLVIASLVVHDDRIDWDRKALNIYVKHHLYQEGKVSYKDPFEYYSELLNEKVITQDRFEKILVNLKK